MTGGASGPGITEPPGPVAEVAVVLGGPRPIPWLWLAALPTEDAVTAHRELGREVGVVGYAEDAADDAAAAAADARAAGRRVMVYQLSHLFGQFDPDGEIVDWSMAIEAIESQGWKLHHLTGITDNHAVSVFRRR